MPVEIASFSKKGYSPYYPRKPNQDSYVFEKDGHTGVILIAVFDGHGKY